MKIAVRYYTKTGNTKRMAEAVAKAVGVEALPISTPITEPVDILFLGIPTMRLPSILKYGSLLRHLIGLWSERLSISDRQQ